MKNGSNFIMMFNDIFNCLSNNERYLYAWLYRYRHQFQNDWKTLVTIDFIAAILKVQNVKLQGNDRFLKSMIKDILVNLKNEKYIDFEIPISSTDSIISISYFENGEHHSGFEKLQYDIFDKFTDPLEFTIYNYINRYGSNGRHISDSQWEDILGVSKTKLRAIIDKMNTTNHCPRIWKFSGTYIIGERARQEENQYYTNPNNEVIDNWNKWYNASGKIKPKKHKDEPKIGFAPNPNKPEVKPDVKPESTIEFSKPIDKTVKDNKYIFGDYTRNPFQSIV